jgi:anti-anti-sigma factor
MDINRHHEGNILVLEPAGRIDDRGSQELLEAVLGLLQEGQRRVVVDLAQAEHIGGAGIRVLLMLTKKLDGANGRLVLCSLNSAVTRAFEVSGFSRRFNIAGTRSEAVSMLSGDERVARVSDLAAKLLRTAADRDHQKETSERREE